MEAGSTEGASDNSSGNDSPIEFGEHWSISLLPVLPVVSSAVSQAEVESLSRPSLTLPPFEVEEIGRAAWRGREEM